MNIEKDIPIPKRKERGTWTKMARQMEVGDSVLLDIAHHADALRWALYSVGCKGSARKIAGEGWRVWRIK